MRFVIDASALAEVLLDTPRGRTVGAWLSESSVDLHAPHLVISECLSVIRGWLLSRQIDDRVAAEAVRALQQFPVQLWDERPFLPEAWRLHQNVSAYDAQYVALAVAVDATLVTGDGRLARAAAVRCSVRSP